MKKLIEEVTDKPVQHEVVIDGETIKFETKGDRTHRIYVLTGPEKSLEKIDKFLQVCHMSGGQGHSLGIRFGSDGDGDFRPKVEYPKLDALTPEEAKEFGKSEIHL